ncbi:MAG: Na+/H+ antiporter NhaA [Bacteroidetes bacterium]|nr:Na+/H+ antiporter NhaA [Bacteroidota bacterium]
MNVKNILTDPIKDLADSGKLAGLLLILATVLSLTLSNSARAASYLSIWHIEVGFDFLHESILHWINDGLMAVFFFLIGLEIKRELRFGELAVKEKAILPVLAAFGGMLFPAMIFFLFNSGSKEHLQGWAIPTATDIAFSLGILSLLGKRAPISLKIFLTALAIIDDLGAIVIIATFYTNTLHLSMLLYAFFFIIALFLLNRFKVKYLVFYIIPALGLWYFILKSGVHPTIAGVVAAMFIPGDIAHKLELNLNRPVNYWILPLFALANTAIPLQFDPTRVFSGLTAGIILGLVAGKPLGIILFSWIGVKLKISSLPKGTSWKQLSGTGLLAGIGFTMSIFIAGLSYRDPAVLDISKLSILAGSTLSALCGMGVLYFLGKKKFIR